MATHTSGSLVSVNPSALGCAFRDTATFVFLVFDALFLVFCHPPCDLFLMAGLDSG